MKEIRRRTALKLGAALGAGLCGVSQAEPLPPLAKIIVGFRAET